jgi:hypothetical protein
LGNINQQEKEPPQEYRKRSESPFPVLRDRDKKIETVVRIKIKHLSSKVLKRRVLTTV